ncbi:MAG: NifU family protein [Bacteroidota bacterium]
MIYTEITPNPSSLKFVLSQTLLPRGSADFPNLESADEAPLVKKLFDFTFVDRVFLGANFITVTKLDSFQWEEVIPVVKDFLKGYIASGQPILSEQYLEEINASNEPDPVEDEVTQKIKSLLESHVRPAVAMDGGDIIYEDFQDGVVKLRLQGSCSGCPSSTMTLKAGIEGLLTRMVPEVKSVEAV